MVSDRHLKREGVDKLLKSQSGREYLGKLQKKYELDILQPSDPRFKKVYGKKLERQRKQKEKNEQIAKDMWQERKEIKEYEAQGNGPSADRKKIQL